MNAVHNKKYTKNAIFINGLIHLLCLDEYYGGPFELTKEYASTYLKLNKCEKRKSDFYKPFSSSKLVFCRNIKRILLGKNAKTLVNQYLERYYLQIPEIPVPYRGWPVLSLVLCWCEIGLPVYNAETNKVVNNGAENFLKVYALATQQRTEKDLIVYKNDLQRFLEVEQLPLPSFWFEAQEKLKSNEPEQTTNPNVNKFIDRGGFYEIVFNQNKSHINKIKGLQYLFHLIDKKDVTMEDLYFIVNPQAPLENSKIDYNDVDSFRHEERLDSLPDKKTVDAIQVEIEQCKENLEIAKTNGNIEQIEEYRAKIDNLKEWMPDKYSKHKVNPYKDKVGKALKRAIKIVQEQHSKELAEHFREHIKPSIWQTPLRYEASIEWQTNDT